MIPSWESHTISVIFFSIILSLAPGCGGGAPASPQNSLEQDSSVFGGLSGVEKQSDGSWLLSWSAIANAQALYGVYVSDSATNMSFKDPIATTRQSSYRYLPENVLSEGQKCFAVRVIGAGDSNSKVLCNTAIKSSFAGLDSLTALADASYLLRWVKLPVDDAVYLIFERDSAGAYDFSSPSYQQKSDFYKTAVAARGSSKCYVVRVEHRSYGNDTNNKELCTTLEKEIEFGVGGNVPVVADRATDGSRLVTWNASPTEGVEGYKVYLDNQCSLAATCLGGVSKVSQNQCTLTNLQNKQYEVCVIAVDKAGRESLPIVSSPFNQNNQNEQNPK